MEEEDFFNRQFRTQKIKQKQDELKQQENDEKEKKQLETDKKKKDDGKMKKEDEEDQKKQELDKKSQEPDQKGKSVKSSKSSRGESVKSKKSKKKKKDSHSAKELSKPELMVEKAIGKPYYLVPDGDAMEIDKEKQYNEENKVRRWNCFISEIRIENLQKDDLTVFLNFRIGQVYKSKDSKKKNNQEDISSEEVFFKSEIVKDVKRSDVKVIKVMFTCEMHLSYKMLRERYFAVEIWEYRRFKLNLFLGKFTVPMVSIASGFMKRSDVVKKAFGDKRQFARLYYCILFQEVWDYKLTFEAWKGSNIIGDGGALLDPKIKLELQTEDALVNPSVESEVIKKTKNPNFRDLKGYMHYRGTMESLTEQMVLVTLYKDDFFDSIQKLVSLRGIQDTNYLKIQFRLKLKKPPMTIKKLIQRKEREKKQQEDQDGEESESHVAEVEEEDEDEMLQDSAVYATIEGRLNLNHIPRYLQVGEMNRYIEGQYYLVVIVNRLNNVLSPDDRGVINSYLTVSWRDQTKQTIIIKDNPNPTYNEELYFRLPILKKKLSLEDRLNQKTEESLLLDAIREELKSRPDVTINLWLDGQDIMTDESLGYVRVTLSELQNAQKFPRTMITNDNRKLNFDTRLATFSKKFESGLFSVSHINITFQLCFAPDLPSGIDLRDFNQPPQDIYPADIAEHMVLDADYKENNKLYKEWDETIRSNFKGFGGIEKNAYSIFFNNVFVKDQNDQRHLVSKYLEKFYLRYQNQEGTKELFGNPEDISLKTLHELAHFVRNIPYIQDSYTSKDVWMSPDFFLNVRKGFVHDHAVLACCLFLGCELQDKHHQEEIKKLKGGKIKPKPYVPLDNRVFLCLGTLKSNKNFHAWVMTINEDFDGITFWDVQENYHFDLKGRIAKKQRSKLRRFLYPDKPKEEKGNFLSLGGGNSKNNQKMSKKKQRREERRRINEEKRQQQEEEEKKKQEKLDEEKRENEQKKKKERMLSKFQADDLPQDEEQQIMMTDIGKATVKIKNDRQQGIVKLPTTKKKKKEEDDKEIEKKSTKKTAFQNPFFQQGGGNQDKKKTALSKRLDEEEEKRQKNPLARFMKAEDFKDDSGNPIVENFELPYETIELIINQKNIFANLGNQNPQEIYYHLHRFVYMKSKKSGNDKIDESKQWLPLIQVEKLKEDDEDMDDDDDDDDDDDEEENDDFDKITKIVPWDQKIGVFYSAQILSEPIPKAKIKKLLEDIFFDVKGGIEKLRAKEGLSTKWKHQEDKLNKKINELIKILEYRDTDRSIKVIEKKKELKDEDEMETLVEKMVETKNYNVVLDHWLKEIKQMVPKNFKMALLPVRFTYTESEKIRSIIIENMTSFFMKNEKEIIFHLTGKIYNYPNKVNCVRLVLGYTFNQLAEHKIKVQEEENEEDQEPEDDHRILDELDEEQNQESKAFIEKK